jgi:hypothetical protein
MFRLIMATVGAMPRRDRAGALGRGQGEQDRRERRAELVAQNGQKAILGVAGGSRDLLAMDHLLVLLRRAQAFGLRGLPLGEIDQDRVEGDQARVRRVPRLGTQLHGSATARARDHHHLHIDRAGRATTSGNVVEKPPAIGSVDETGKGVADEAGALAAEHVRGGEVQILDRGALVEEHVGERREIEIARRSGRARVSSSCWASSSCRFWVSSSSRCTSRSWLTASSR